VPSRELLLSLGTLPAGWLLGARNRPPVCPCGRQEAWGWSGLGAGSRQLGRSVGMAL